MTSATDPNLLSLLPMICALVLAFWTRNAIFSLFTGTLVGVMLGGSDPASGLASLFKTALGNPDFIWVVMIEISVGILIAMYMRSGVIAAFEERASTRIRSRRSAKGFGWMMGVFIFFSDYFSPLFSGPITKPLTDRHHVSREMLAYLLDSGSAPVSTLIPMSAWAAYVASLLVGHGPILTISDGLSVFIRAIPYNLYGWFAVILSGLIAFEIVPNFGPMKRAELRARTEHKVVRDGSNPLAGSELEQITSPTGRRTNLGVYLLGPVLIILFIAVGTFVWFDTSRILEAFIAAVLYLCVAMFIGGYFDSVNDAISLAVIGIKAVLPAVLILALAYLINSVSRDLGAQEYILSVTKSWMTPTLLPVIVFLAGSFISFFTGTSWGTYAIVVPFAIPLAFTLSGGQISPIVLATVGALVGGGLFGDHCSPVSDTTVLSSLGAGSDHMDHVVTQVPYALLTGLLAAIVYVVIGMS